ncbi:bifunctional 5,10-methylene-tetrahydrofolate dehydrogenase/5,10-methylene-tetrahydrofolate cyclohydrolase [Sphingobacteriales bacterium UPWRP_1]|nr:bifunctional 5,10-methylene-tetrahydrofolate dehydrogenase/5,10-methylene-tetrahydrofolate cyclohydrolase [Sphingobacteriales bacterium TSM_CSS]PSJ78757.1 bifunctional 5,10-methylene-tetrahydrofolate dehydrogenase/5,10-methylene-tetrahydrofolate cyclohydrolase [Sphingobacteriales bacterium UPWRP_1]
MKLLDGKKLAEIVKQEIKEEVDRLVAANHKRPNLAAVLVGNDGASETYVQHKVRACKEVGFDSTLIRLPETTTEESLLAQIDRLNKSTMIDGFIVQLPLPKHIDVEKVTQAIKPGKDVDGFHPVNVGRMAQGLPCYLPATPYGILQLLERNGIETSGKDCVVLGRSNIVGTPISILLSRNQYPGNCTVTLCHSRTKNLEKYTKRADILIVALGQPEFVTAKMVKKGAVVVDVGITRIEDDSKRTGYRLAGDVKYDEVAPKCSFITPVPGGVGPMTVVSLLLNTLKAANKEINYPD